MFATIARSWEFAKISYGIVWDFKKLIIFPLLSTIAAALVIASFVTPMWASGTLQQWLAFADPESGVTATTSEQVTMYTTLFLFYFCNYFVIVFFNAALTACAMRVVDGESPTIGYGLSMAGKRLPQIFGWALVSAVIGVLLRVIENMNEKVGYFVAAILGSAWTALTYFVVPVVVMEGVGPIAAIKRSVGTLKATWGEALVGNFSMGFLAMIVIVPAFIVAGMLAATAFSAGNMMLVGVYITMAVLITVVALAVTSAADVVFKALLYNHATGKSVPDSVDPDLLEDAFRSKTGD